MTLGQRIQAGRTRLGLSQEGLGNKLGVSRQAVSKWEADGAVPDTDKLISLSKLFGITLNDLLQVEQPEEVPPPEEAGPPPAEGTEGRRLSLRLPSRRQVLAALAAAVLLAAAGLYLNLRARVADLEAQVLSLQVENQAARIIQAEELVADWGYQVRSVSSAGWEAEFQVTTARYDPQDAPEVFFLMVKEGQAPKRAQAAMDPAAPGVYTARVTDDDLNLLSQFTLSVGFVWDGVEYVCPLAAFSKLGSTYNSYEPLWP